MIDVVMPQLGESVAEGTVTKWLVREGDRVDRQQPIVVVSTDKADSEVTSTAAGRVVRLVAAEGQTLATGKVLCTIDETASAEAAPPRPAPAPAPVPAASPAQAAAVQATAVQAAPAPAPAATATATPIPGATGAPAPASAAEQRPLASPSTRRAALEAGVDLRAVAATGERGRITQDDVRKAAGSESALVKVEARPEPAITAPPSQPVSRAEPPMSRPAPSSAAPDSAELAALIQAGGGFVPPMSGPNDGAAGRLPAPYAPIPGVGFGAYKVPPYTQRPGDKVVPFTRRRRITADHMVYSKVTAPHVVTVAEVDLHATSRLRDENKDRLKKEGVSLTFLAFVCSAVIKALRENPEVNARVLDNSYVVLKDINLGIAVDTAGGLIVPSIKQADQLSLRGIAGAIDQLAARARAGKVTADDLANTTFTVSNPGLKGNLFGGAIISQPNVGILRMGEIKKRPVVVTRDGEDVIAIHPVMYVALSYDHRIIDGVLANSFLWRVGEILSKGEFEV
jgi:2-oxoglutarate dehydrogenase E2 component (dihydrolipoamide succinyltransferase)